MGLLGRRAPTTTGDLATYIPTPPTMRVLRADGARIDLSSRIATQQVANTRQPWVATAWAYRDLIGELRYAVRLLAQSVARVRYYPAELRAWPDDPIPLDSEDCTLDKQLIADALHNFGLIPLDTSPDGFTARMVENLAIAGEAWIHVDADATMRIRSTSEVTVGGDGRVTFATTPGGRDLQPIDPNNEALLRCWVPHPEWSDLADSPMRALLDVAEDVVLTGREMRAASRSRIAANGILLIPASMSLIQERDAAEDSDGDGIEHDTFMEDLAAALLAPLQDDGQAGQVVPVVLRGDTEDLDKVRHLTLQRADSDKLIDRQASALLRLLKGLDVQPEQVEGVGGMNHWGAFVVDSRSIHEQIEPKSETVAACLMQAWLKPALESLNYPAEQVKRITIVADTSELAENPNRGQDARDAWDRFAISDDTLRRELGFDDSDEPEPEEFVRRLAAMGKLPVEDTARVLGIRREAPQTVNGQVAGQPAQLPSGGGDSIAEQPAPAAPADMPTAAPATPPAAPITAAADPDPFGMHVDEDACRALAAIDASLAERVGVAADAALNRVLERAGAKVRSAVQKDRALVAQLANLDTAAIPAALGRDKVEAFVPVADLVADEYTRLRGQVVGWLRDAAVQTGLAACDVIGVNPNGAVGQRLSATITSRLTSNIDPAWQVLRDELHEAAEWALFDDGTEDGDEVGERTGSPLSAQDIADVLAVAGGDRPTLIASADDTFARRDDKGKRRRHRRPDKKRRTRDTPGTGVATGPIVQDTLAAEGAVLIGWEWDYREFVPRKMFEPHHRLDGTRVSTWSDPKLDTDPRNAWIGASFHPGDHNGCFIAGTEVSGPPATASFVRPYQGEGVEIRTDSGKVLTGTPNHPILTPRGWVPMGELCEGDEVVVAADGERALEVDDQAYQVPALIEDVCATLPMAGGVVTRPVPTAAEDFHGDGAGSDGQVTVVRADRSLLLDNETATTQLGSDDVLLLGGHGHGSLTSDGVAQALVPGEGLAAHRVVSVPRDGLPLLGGGAEVAMELGFAPVSGGDTGLRDDAADHSAVAAMLAGEREFAGAVAVVGDDHGLVSRGEAPPGVRVAVPLEQVGNRHVLDAEVGSDGVHRVATSATFLDGKRSGVVGGPVDGADCDASVDQEPLDDSVGYPLPTSEGMDRFAGGVTTEKVVGIRRLPLDCHVYNLTTVTGWYVANGVIVHNCQCGSIPVYARLDDPEGIVARRLAAAKGDPRRVAVDQLAAADDAAGRTGTSAQQTAEIRRRLTDAIDAMRAAHIENPRPRRGRK